MIEIKCAAAETAQRLNQSVGVTADYVWEMTERDTRLGFSCVQTNGEETRIVWLEAPDVALTDALLRATLNALRAMGQKQASVATDFLLKHIALKGYTLLPEKNMIEIEDFFAKSACNG